MLHIYVQSPVDEILSTGFILGFNLYWDLIYNGYLIWRSIFCLRIIVAIFNIVEIETKVEYNIVNIPTGRRTGYEQGRAGHKEFQRLIKQDGFT